MSEDELESKLGSESVGLLRRLGKSFRSMDGGLVFGGICAAIMGTVLGVPPYNISVAHQEFLEKKVVTIEGSVVDERYVPSTISGGGLLSTPTEIPSQYFFSSDLPEGLVTIQVFDSYEQKKSKESVDAQLVPGTRFVAKARKVAPGEYKAFANQVFVQ